MGTAGMSRSTVMNENVHSSFDLGSVFGAYIGTIIAIWVVCAIVAAAVAPRGRRGEFFLSTLFFLGPLGVGFASVAQPRERYGGGSEFVKVDESSGC
jgi:hypothetical protein